MKGEKEKPPTEDSLTNKDKITNENDKSFSGQLKEMTGPSTVKSNMTGEQKDVENGSAAAVEGVLHTKNIESESLDDKSHADEDKKEDTVSMDVDAETSNQVICNRLEIVPRSPLSRNKVATQKDYIEYY